jgi:hypothetical protein
MFIATLLTALKTHSVHCRVTASLAYGVNPLAARLVCTAFTRKGISKLAESWIQAIRTSCSMRVWTGRTTQTSRVKDGIDKLLTIQPSHLHDEDTCYLK